MSKRFFPGEITGMPLGNERGSTTSTLLLVLLLLLAVGGYLFYFTDLIRPAKKAATPQAVSTVQVKTPIPPRPEQPAGEGAGTAKPAETKPATVSTAPAPGTPAPAPPAASPAKPAAEPKPVSATPAPSKPGPQKSAKVEAPPKPAPVPAKVPSAVEKPPVTQPAASKPATSKQAAPATVQDKPAPKKTVATTNAKPAEKPAVAGKSGKFTLLIGDFIPGQSIAEVQAKLKKSGILPISRKVITATESMNRLFIADFSDQDTAEAELQKLKKVTSDAFLVVDNGRYNLYAGSYFSESRLHSEVRRLSEKGIKPVVRRAQIKIKVKVTRVTAGSFESVEEAGKAVKRLKKQGITAKAIKLGN